MRNHYDFSMMKGRRNPYHKDLNQLVPMIEYPPEVLAELRGRVSIDGVKAAREIVSRHLPRTPLIRHPLLCDELGCDVHIKHENHLPTGAFKVRGGFNYVANLPEEKRRAGIITATRGNHGQSLALASQTFGVRCVIVVPHGNNPEKNAAMRAYGADLIETGTDYEDAREHAESLVESEGLTYLHGGNEPLLTNGVGTYSLEIHEDLPDVDTIVVPVGGGSGVCGAIAVFRALKPEVEIIGVQAEEAPSIYDSWRKGERVSTESCDTFADGLATRIPMQLPFEIIREGIDRMVLVSEDEIREAVLLLLRTTHNLAEGAGAASTAAVRKLGDELRGKKVVAVLSGGNLDRQTLQRLLGAS